MKICSTCKKEKPLGEFTLRGGIRADYQSTCKDCVRAIKRNRAAHNLKLIQRWKMIKGCSCCSFKAEHPCQLDIDHITPSSHGRPSALNTQWSKNRIKEELSKCQVLCANCHRLKTYNDGTMFKRRIDD